MLDRALDAEGDSTSWWKRLGNARWTALVEALPFALEAVFSLPAQIADKELDKHIQWRHISQVWAAERGGFREPHTNQRVSIPQCGPSHAWATVPFFDNLPDYDAGQIRTPPRAVPAEPESGCKVDEQNIVVMPLTAYSLIVSLLFGYEGAQNEPRQAPFSMKDFFRYKEESQFQKFLCLVNFIITHADALRRNLPRAPIVLEFRTVLYGWTGSALEHVGCVLQTVKLIDPSTAFVAPAKVQEVSGAWVMDFADRSPGGFTLSWGTAQEELLVIQHPEILLLTLCCPILGDLDAVRIRNVLPICDYEGYESSFRVKHLWEVKPKMSIDVLVVDAIDYHSLKGKENTSLAIVLREINKLTAGLGDTPGRLLSTGNWGCGHFGGDVAEKFVIQWLVASICDCPMVYFSFNLEVQERLLHLKALIEDYQLSARELWQYMRATILLSPREAFLPTFEQILISAEELSRRSECADELKKAFDEIVLEKVKREQKN